MLKIGNTYKDQDGDMWKIVYEDPARGFLGIYDDLAWWFDENGLEEDGDIQLTLPTTKHEGWVVVTISDAVGPVVDSGDIYLSETHAKANLRGTVLPQYVAKITWESPE